jgi:hypothetical protein
MVDSFVPGCGQESDMRVSRVFVQVLLFTDKLRIPDLAKSLSIAFEGTAAFAVDRVTAGKPRDEVRARVLRMSSLHAQKSAVARSDLCVVLLLS